MNMAVNILTIDSLESVKAFLGNYLLHLALLPMIGWTNVNILKSEQAKLIEPVFSHVQHTMWIKHSDGLDHVVLMSANKWSLLDGKELQWISEEMKEVGVTAGVSKIDRILTAPHTYGCTVCPLSTHISYLLPLLLTQTGNLGRLQPSLLS